MSHSIAYAVFQIMFGLFMSSPIAKMTAEGDYITLPAKQMIRLLEQPNTAGIRYYFTLTPQGKISAVIVALDSSAKENRTIIVNAQNRAVAERAIKNYEEKKMVDVTGTLYGTIGIGSQNGTLVYTQGKQELLQLAKSGKQFRAYYALKEENGAKPHLILCFAQIDGSGAVMVRSATEKQATILDFSGDCPPSCKYP
jgi:hypothetical protein